MNAFLGQDWAGIPVALAVAALGYLALRAGRRWDRRRAKVALVVAGGFAAALGTLLLCGASWHFIEVQRLSTQYPPPGQLHDVGGFRMHMMPAGERRVGPEGTTPTVVFVSGGYAPGLALSHLHERLSADTRTIIFDRAGVGWSEPSPEPRHVRNDVADLERLLDAAGETGPFILVGHSWGGLFSIAFAKQYPDLTAGLVLFEPTPPDQLAGAPAAALALVGDARRKEAIASLFGLGGVVRGFTSGPESDPESPEFIYEPIFDEWKAMTATRVRSRSGIAVYRSFADTLADPRLRVDAPGDLGDTPLLVAYREDMLSEIALMEPAARARLDEQLAKSLGADEAGVEAYLDSQRQEWAERSRLVASFSSRGRLIHPPAESTHNFPYEHPEFCADAVREMIMLVTTRSGAEQ